MLKMMTLLMSMTVLLGGCAEMGIAAQIASAGANLYSTHQDSQKKIYSKDCIFTKPIYVDPNYETRLTEEERRAILTHNEQWEALCQP